MPEMEVVEVASSSHPTLWIPRDQVFSMEPEQDKVHPSEVPVPEPVPVAVVKPPEGARSNLSAPLPVEPDLRPPPKEYGPLGKALREDEPPRESRFGKIGKRKPGRPRKDKK